MLEVKKKNHTGDDADGCASGTALAAYSQPDVIRQQEVEQVHIGSEDEHFLGTEVTFRRAIKTARTIVTRVMKSLLVSFILNLAVY